MKHALLLALLLALLAACEGRPVTGAAPGVYLGGSLGAFAVHSR